MYRGHSPRRDRNERRHTQPRRNEHYEHSNRYTHDQPFQRPARPPSEDDDYTNCSLYYFKGAVSEYVNISAARQAILRLYTGHPAEDWLIRELVDCMSGLVQYSSGIAFLASLNDKMGYWPNDWIQSLFRYFQQILTCTPGYHLFSVIVWHAPDNYLTSFIRFSFDKFGHEEDPAFFHLLSVIVQVISDTPNEYTRFLSLHLYFEKPTASSIARSILECGDAKVISRFQDEIIGNVQFLMSHCQLCEILIGLLERGPMMYRDAIISHAQSRYPELILDPGRVSLVMVILGVGTMPQKYYCADAVGRILIGTIEPNGLVDTLMVHALNCLDLASRARFIGDFCLQARVGGFRWPILSDYLANIGKVISCHPT